MNGQNTNKQKEAVTFFSRSVHTTTTLINYLLHGHQLRNENDCCTRCAAVFLNKRTKHDSSSSQTEDLAANTGNISHAHTHTHTHHSVCVVLVGQSECVCVCEESQGGKLSNATMTDVHTVHSFALSNATYWSRERLFISDPHRICIETIANQTVTEYRSSRTYCYRKNIIC